VRILIPCPFYRGHNLYFCRLLAGAAADLKCRGVVLLPRDAQDTPEIRTHLLEPDLCEVRCTLPTFTRGSIRSSLEYTTALRQAVVEYRCAWMWVHFADAISVANLLQAKRAFSVPHEELYLRGAHGYQPSLSLQQRARSALSRLAIKQSRALSKWHLDPLSYQYLLKSVGSIGLMPEPVPTGTILDPVDARKLLGIPNDKVVIGLVGSLDKRKGAPELLQALHRLRSPHLSVAIMGAMEEDIAAEVHSYAKVAPRGSVIIVDRTLTSREFDAAFQACDWHSLLYQRHIGSSGILVRACAFGKPVLASNYGWIGEATTRFDLGLTCDSSSPTSICEQLERIAQNPKHVFAEAVAGFVKFNSEANFSAHWTLKLRRHLGMPEDSNMCTLP